MPLRVIGVVRTGHSELAATPIQAGLNRAEQGILEIAARYRAGLEGLAGFDYLWLLTWLHRLATPGSDPPLRQVPFLLQNEQREMGVFATRSPRRVNPIGLSLVRLDGVEGREVRFRGVDLVDGTPVLDIKPVMQEFLPRGTLRQPAWSHELMKDYWT